MCGIAGAAGNFYDLVGTEELLEAVKERGRDARGSIENDGMRVRVVQSRLAIVDPQSGSNQPRKSDSGRYVFAFNGEIYNFKELSAHYKLSKACHWSDVEFFSEFIDRFGPCKLLQEIEGMYAISIIDLKRREILLASDERLQKPLYYIYNQKDGFVFSSEISEPLARLSGRRINRLMLIDTIVQGYSHGEDSVFNGVKRLLPGQKIIYSIDAGSITFMDTKRSGAVGENRLKEDFIERTTYETLVETALKDAVSKRLDADVAVGLFLSGGIDSALVAAMCSAQNRRMKTISIGFGKSDEHVRAEVIARHLGHQNIGFVMDEFDALEICQSSHKIYKEPFADNSLVPTVYICRKAREIGLKVCLTGDGSDEIFCGYNNYKKSADLAGLISPRKTRLVGAIANSLLAALIYGESVTEGKLLKKSVVRRLITYLALTRESSSDINNWLRSRVTEIDLWPLKVQDFSGDLRNRSTTYMTYRKTAMVDLCDSFMQHDIDMYLPFNMCVKIDRASMHSGVELRSPFMDCQQLHELAYKMPASWRQSRTEGGKALLRGILKRHIPANLISKEKQGFSMPIGRWLKTGNLREWSMDNIHSAKAQEVIGYNLVSAVSMYEKSDVDNAIAKRLFGLSVVANWINHSELLV